MSMIANSFRVVAVVASMAWGTLAQSATVLPAENQRLAAVNGDDVPANANFRQAYAVGPSGHTSGEPALKMKTNAHHSPNVGVAGNEMPATLFPAAPMSIAYVLNQDAQSFAADPNVGVAQNNISQRFQYSLQAGRQHVLQIEKDNGGSDVVAARVSAVPLPGAMWMFGTALLGFLGFSSRRSV